MERVKKEAVSIEEEREKKGEGAWEGGFGHWCCG